ncbi:MAG: PSD1 domain-containing protein, partial [Pirellulaceae bacterium]|nr:PSD1 domain-containing protein [Pirellulaceae bacterium]
MRPLTTRVTTACLGVLAALASTTVLAQSAKSKPLPPEQVKFFETKIRPVLVEHCYACHSADSRDLGGGLQVDGRPGLLKGGDNGPAVVPGKPQQSLLLTAMKHSDRNLIMPPKESGPKLSDSVLADFETWIRQGAVDPRSDMPKSDKKKYDPEAAKQWWAWKARKQITPPSVPNQAWVRDPIDQFVLAKLNSEGLHPNADADRVTLVRRLAFDLTGLPPSVPELYDFALSPNPKPLEQLVDRYLDSTAYGERMARRWLDVARYAESAGKDLNGMFPHAWRYRDYVIDAFNADMSYRNFIAEQLAGDLLPPRSPSDQVRRTIATGFLAIGPKGLNDMNARQFAVDVADEQIDTLSQAFLGVTIACARCHDHKFDPISQRDYTAMAGIFLSTETHFGTQGGVGGRNRSTLVSLPKELADEKAYSRRSAAELEQMNERFSALRKEQSEMLIERAKERAKGGSAGNPGPEFLRVQQQVVSLETELAQYNPDGSLKALAMGVSDKPSSASGSEPTDRRRNGPLANLLPRGPAGRPVRLPQRPGALPREMTFINDSPLLERGEIDKPGERVPRGLPEFFAKGNRQAMPSTSSGRLELARWIASDANPLTSRVMVNRIWGWTMGRGLVASVDNFGTTGDLPSHPELLDYLAGEFIQDGWSVKGLVRRIVLSHTYALSSDMNTDNFARDPDNQYLWRANLKTLEAEAVRDAVLVAAGALDHSRPHGSLISQAGDGVIGGRPNAPRAAGLGEEQIAKAQGLYRSIYLPVPRNLLPDALELFDFPDNSMVHGTRETTLVPGQSLYWMNSQAVDRAAQQIAVRALPGVDLFPKSKTKRIQNQATEYQSEARDASKIDVAARFSDICLLTLSRLPLPAETEAVAKFVSDQRQRGASEGETWTSVCRSLLSSADF